MKKRTLIFSLALILIFPMISAATCNLDVSLVNQDPIHAVPGDYVKVVFQIDGIENPECGTVEFEIKETYPFSLDPDVSNKVSIQSGTYSRKYSSFYLATYNLRVDKDALNGDNPIEVLYGKRNGAEFIKEFNINVEDTRTDFDVYVKNYDYLTREITFEILNIEDVDIEALTIEIPKQESFSVKGANKKVVGDLDSNEYTSADFEMVLPDGETEIELDLIYTDAINVRREITKKVMFDSSYFTDRNGDKKSSSWIWIVLIIAIVAWLVYRKVKKNKEKKKRMMKHAESRGKH